MTLWPATPEPPPSAHRARWPRAPQPPRPPQPDRNRLILALWAQGDWSFATLGEHLGVSRNVIAGVVDRARGRKRGGRR